MNRMAVTVVCFLLILACSTEEHGIIKNTHDENEISTDTVNLEEQTSTQSNITEQNDDPDRDSSRLPAESFPECMYRPLPEYPDSALDAGIEGEVNVIILLDSLGAVVEVEIYSSSESYLLDQAAIDAAWKSKWLPAEDDGVGISVWTAVHYDFVLQD